MVTAVKRVQLIGITPVGLHQRKGYQASHSVEHSAVCRVSVWSIAPNAWNQNWHSSNPGNQNNNGKTNTNCVRAARLPEAMKYA